MKKILAISGPNLNLPETRTTSIDEEHSLDEIHGRLRKKAAELEMEVDCERYDSDGEIIDRLQQVPGTYAGVVLNAGALAHYSYSLRSAIGTMLVPCVEVCMSNVRPGEESRHTSVIADVCLGTISGFGAHGYVLALEALANLFGV